MTPALLPWLAAAGVAILGVLLWALLSATADASDDHTN